MSDFEIDLAITGAYVLPMDQMPPIADGVVTVKDGCIVEVGPSGAVDLGRAARVIDAPSGAVLPGLVNCHTHNASNLLLRGLLEDVELFQWLRTMWQLKQNFDHETLYWASLAGLIEMVRSGVTTFNEHFDAYRVEPEAEALKTLPLKATLGYGLADVGLYQPISEWSWAALADFEKKVQRHHQSQSGRVEVALSPHAPYSCSAEMWRRVRAVADDLNLKIHTHLAEGLLEVAYVRDNYGLTPTAWLESLGLLGPDVTAAHCTQLTEADIAILAGQEVKIAHCPICNCKLVSGTMNLRDVQGAGIAVGLATDGPASHNTVDLFQEMKFAAIIHKDRTGDPEFFRTREVLNMATTAAARVMHRPGLGRLVPGAPADIIVVELHRPHTLPVYDPEATLVYASRADDVRYTIVDGKILLDDGRLVGLSGSTEEEVLNNFRRSALALKARSFS